MTDDYLKFPPDNFNSDKLNLDDFPFDMTSAIPENELLEFNPTAFTGTNDVQTTNPSTFQSRSLNLNPQDMLRQVSSSSVDPAASSFHNSYISPINSPYAPSHLSTSFQPQRKNSIYDTLESVSSPQTNNADTLTAQYFSPPPNRSIPLSTSRKSTLLGPSSVQTFNTSHTIASPGSLNDALSPYSSFDNFKSPRSMAASPAGPGTSLPKQQLSKEEKLRRRREFHNQVERRRRDLIKEKIKELGLIVPPSLLYVDSDGKEVKASKTVIINKTVEYVVHLHKVMTEQEKRKAALLNKISELEVLPDVNSATPASQSADEQVLKSEFDVGDLGALQAISSTNSFGDSPAGQIKFETDGTTLDFDVNELLKQHSGDGGWDGFDQN